jgi:succinate dehydrogenase / fumarate reductase cytochrome b subunit
MSSSGFIKSSVGRKVAMALSGFFLVFFLLQHLSINMLSILSPDLFNEVSHFMGTNPIVQFGLQPVLLFGVLFHLATGIILELQNKKARPVQYAYNKPETNSSWMSRNMVITGIMIMLFLGVHFYDFWIPEVSAKFIDGDWSGKMEGVEGFRYFTELQHKMSDPIRSGIYTVAFIFLSLHLQHGFASMFQSVGYRHNKRTAMIEKIGKGYAIVVPALFIVIAWFHVLNSNH